MKKWIFLGLFSTTLYSCGNNSSIEETKVSDTDTPSVNQENPPTSLLPDFPLKNSKGETLNLQNFKGKKVLVNLWASWCGPCRAEMPSIQALYNKVKDSNVVFVLVGLDNEFEKSMAYLKENGLSLPVYAPATELPEYFNVPGIPTTFIFNESGNLIKKIEGGNDYDTDEFVQLLTTN